MELVAPWWRAQGEIVGRLDWKGMAAVCTQIVISRYTCYLLSGGTSGAFSKCSVVAGIVVPGCFGDFQVECPGG